MKKFLRNWFVNSLDLAIVSWFFNGLKVNFDIGQFLLSTLIITFVIKLLKPVFSIIFLPLNILTFGMFNVLKTVIALGAVIYLTSAIKLEEFDFPGLNLGSLDIKPFWVPAYVSLLVASFLMVLCQKLVRWLLKTK